MNILAIDYGTKNIGLAIKYDDIDVITKLPILKNDGTENIIDNLARKIAINRINTVVVGYPVNAAGELTKMCEKIDAFIEILKEKTTGISIEKVNEELSSKHASLNFSESGFKSGKLDSEAARIILQDFLDTYNY